jgi:hypothetical protein
VDASLSSLVSLAIVSASRRSCMASSGVGTGLLNFCNGRGRVSVILVTIMLNQKRARGSRFISSKSGQDKTRQESKLVQSRNFLCYTRERVKREEKESLHAHNSPFIYNSSASLEPILMLRCTIRISSHDLTHHSVLPYHNNHTTSSDVATSQTTSVSY